MVSKQQFARWAGCAAFVVIVVTLAVVPENGWLYAQASSVAVRIQPAAQTVVVNETFTVQIVADLPTEMEPYGLAGYEFQLAYDNTYFEVISAGDAGELSGPNSRTVGSLGPNIANPAGRTTFGAYSYLETTPQIPGPTGSVVLATVTLKARQIGEAALRLEQVIVVDTQARGWPDPATGRQVNTQDGTVTIAAAADTPTVTPSSPASTQTPTATQTPTVTDTPVPTATQTPTDTQTPTLTPTQIPSVTDTPTLAPTSTVTPTPSLTGSFTPTPAATQTSTPVPTGTATPTVTSSLTPMPTAATPTATWTTTATVIPTTSVTPAATEDTTPTDQLDRIYLPMVARNLASDATPARTELQFTCSGWCEPGTQPGMRSQVVTSDRPVDDWRAFVGDILLGVLTEETATRAVLEAPEGFRVRIEARYGGVWLPACESFVECPLP